MNAPEPTHLEGAATPAGWYPDPGGTPAWRRWDGAAWGDATLPFGVPTPDAPAIGRERASWPLLRAVTPWVLALQALGLFVFATQTGSFAVWRHWIRAYYRAATAHQSEPVVPANAIGHVSSFATLTYYLVLVASAVGVIAWLRFSAASLRVAASSGYPHRQHVVVTSILFFIPVVGPLVALAAARATLPPGHEALRVVIASWSSIALAELGWVAVWVTISTTPSESTALVVAAAGAACWLIAAALMPLGLQSVVDDHTSLAPSVRAQALYS